ncbi:MAG: hypothetical protein V9F00_11235 [Nocardioides sp.]
MAAGLTPWIDPDPAHEEAVPPVSVTSPPQRRADVRARVTGAGDARRRAGRCGTASSAHRRRMHRLRRSVFVAITALLFGTVVARVTQDPAVALPRPAVVTSSRVVALEPDGHAPLVVLPEPTPRGLPGPAPSCRAQRVRCVQLRRAGHPHRRRHAAAADATPRLQRRSAAHHRPRPATRKRGWPNPS